MSKRLVVCGTMLKKHHDDLDIDFRAISIDVGSDEVSDTFSARPAVPYLDEFEVKALTSAHLDNTFTQVSQLIKELAEKQKTGKENG